jgi:hypothetical protein
MSKSRLALDWLGATRLRAAGSTGLRDWQSGLDLQPRSGSTSPCGPGEGSTPAPTDSGEHMHNHHARLSQALTEQRMTDRREQAPMRWGVAQTRRFAGARRGRPVGTDSPGCWQLIPWPAAAEHPSRRPHGVS